VFAFLWFLLKAAKLTFTDFYILPVAGAADFNDFGLKLPCDFKGLGTGQLPVSIGFLCFPENSISQILVFGHFHFSTKAGALCIVRHIDEKKDYHLTVL
jgi:hypothetical protein